MSKYLVTFVCEASGYTYHGYEIVNNPVDWVLDTMDHPRGEFFLINSEIMTEEQVEKYNKIKYGE